MQTGQHTVEPSLRPSRPCPHSLTVEETAEALGMFPSSIHRSINYLKSGGTLLSNMEIDFENGCFRKIG